MASKEGEGYSGGASPEALPPISGLGPMMSMEDPTYLAGQAWNACSGMECAGMPAPNGTPASVRDMWKSTHGRYTPGFDSIMLPDPQALLGRWVRSPSKFVGWDVYMEFFGLKDDKALQETEEPQEHVILEFSEEKLRINHRLCWRDGLDCEYTVPIDGSAQPVPPAMVARASSSWKVNDLASWEHAWDDGAGNPLHCGLRTQQKLCIGGTNYALRYWRNLIRPKEMRINVEVTYADTGKYAVHTQRFFHKIDVDTVYAIARLPSCPVTDLPARLLSAAVMTHVGRGVRLAVLPHASNMPAGYKDMDQDARWGAAEPFPSAGRSTGPFLSALRQAARDSCLWVCVGLELKGEKDKDILQASALIGADGWLHGVHTAEEPSDSVFSSGAGDWPATQRARPRGVYDTELGRIAIRASKADEQDLKEYAQMGADVVLQPPADCTARSGHEVVVSTKLRPHKYYTQYKLCGPEPVEACTPAAGKLTLVDDSSSVHMLASR